MGVASAPMAPDRQAPSKLWWLYLGLLFVMGGLQLAMFLPVLINGQFPSGDLPLVIGIAATALNAWSLVGLFFYIRSRPFGAPLLWKVCFYLVLVQVTFVAAQFVKSLSYGIGGVEGKLALLGLAGALLGVPLLFALWRYAFRSPQVLEV